MVILSATVTDQVGCHSLSWLCFSIIVRPNHARLTEPKIVLELFPFKFFCTILNINHINQMLFREVKYHSIITAINSLMVDRSKRVSVAFRPATATSNTEKQSFTYHIMSISGNHISPFASLPSQASMAPTKPHQQQVHLATFCTSSSCIGPPKGRNKKHRPTVICRNHGSSVFVNAHI